MGKIVLFIIGICGGSIISAGVFAIVTSTGLMSRMAGKTHTGKHVRHYETAVAAGGILFNIFWLFNIYFSIQGLLGNIILAFIGVCQGIFVGCLAVSLAEALNATAIFSRRVKLSTGLSFIVLTAAIAKSVASIIQFYFEWTN